MPQFTLVKVLIVQNGLTEVFKQRKYHWNHWNVQLLEQFLSDSVI